MLWPFSKAQARDFASVPGFAVLPWGVLADNGSGLAKHHVRAA
jgi:hypothetical protein